MPGGIRRWWHPRLSGAFLVVACVGSAVAGSFEPADTASWSVPLADLYGVDARGDHVWAVGYWGTIQRSVDGGETWTAQTTPTDQDLYAVAFADETRGWAVGARGTILRTVDAGASWQRQRATIVDEFEESRELDTALFDVAAISAHEAWAVGDFGVILHTLDGKEWRHVVLLEENFGDGDIAGRILNGVHFSDRQNGWITGEFGTTLRTTDGGEIWIGERTLVGAVEDVYLIDITAPAAGQALVSGVGGVVLQTSDGGSTWTAVKLPTTAGLFGVAQRGSDGIVVGDRGVILASRDGGKTWAEPEHPKLFNWLRGVVFATGGRGFVVGQRGVVLRSDDGGGSWRQIAGEAPTPTSGITVPETGGSGLADRE